MTVTQVPRLVCLLLVLTLSACFHHSVRGSGHIVEQARPLAAFDAVEVHGGLTVTAAVGDPTVTLTLDDNLIGLVETRLDGGTLIIQPSERNTSLHPSRGSSIRVTTPNLRAVSASGGSEVTAVATPGSAQRFHASGGSRLVVTGMAADDARIHVSGGSHVELAGTAVSIDARISGGSSLAISNIDARDVAFEASGGSDVDLRGATANVDAHVSGGSKAHTQQLLANCVTVRGSGGSELDIFANTSVTGHLSGGSEIVVLGRPLTRSLSRSGGSEIQFE